MAAEFRPCRVVVIDGHKTLREPAADDLCTARPKAFFSAMIVGNGASQGTPHSFKTVPRVVRASLCGGPAAYVQPVITPGGTGGVPAHDATNCYFKVTAGWTYWIEAWP